MITCRPAVAINLFDGKALIMVRRCYLVEAPLKLERFGLLWMRVSAAAVFVFISHVYLEYKIHFFKVNRLTPN